MKNFIKRFLHKRVYQKVYSFYGAITNINPKALELNKSDRVLILAPHADDEVIGCGALLLRYPNLCDVTVLTDGRYGDSNIEPSKMANIRRDEFKNVMDKIGIKNYSILDIEDSMLNDSYDKFSKIDFNSYNYIFIPNNLDQHPDHKAVFSHILRAYRDGKIDKNINLAMYEVWGALALTNFYIDFSYMVKDKREVINMHKSQVKDYDYATKILGLNSYRGLTASNKDYVESYFILPIKDYKF